MRERENELLRVRPKLFGVVTQDYPRASEILLSFPDRWEWVQTLERERQRIYVGRFPPERERPWRDHFPGLPEEVNLSLKEYRLYQFFQPWPLPRIMVEWNPRVGQGRVLGVKDMRVQMQVIGQAQAWVGQDAAVLWESYLRTHGRGEKWMELLAKLWQVVERDVAVSRIYTAPQEPTFEEGYTEFLGQLRYAPDGESPKWWSKVKNGY